MDEVLEQLQSTALNTENEQTSFDGLYKNWGRFDQQEKRRKNILDNQKRSRYNKLDANRGIIELISSVERFNYDDCYRPSIYVAGFTRASLTYKHLLMHSEWLVEKPEDFESNWVIVPCPKGVRTLVVAYKGSTRFYSNRGDFQHACPTALPCGSSQQSYNSSNCVVLDCFHVKSINKMYILDVLAWKNQPMTDCETEFRHYWLRSKLEELPELETISSKNKMIFELLPMIPCKQDSLNEFMMKLPHFENFVPKLDGLLFYHQKAHYISGQTPLVGWLYPFMVNEVLGSDITVHPTYLLEKPENYTNQADYIVKFEEKHKKKRPLTKKKNVNREPGTEMEQSESHNSTEMEQNESHNSTEMEQSESHNESNETVDIEPNANTETEDSFLMDADKVT